MTVIAGIDMGKEDPERVGAIPGFGPRMVESVCQFLADPEQRALLSRLRERGVGRPQPRA